MRIDARMLLRYSTNELWDILTGDFTLVFDDADVETDSKETLYSSYIWDLIREYPDTPFKVAHHITTVMKGGSLSTGSWSTLFSNVVWDVYRHYITLPEYANPREKVLLREKLSKRLYEIVNTIYNDLTHRLEAYVSSIAIEDFIEVTKQPELIALHERPNFTENDIENGYKLGTRLLITDPEEAKRTKNYESAPLYHNRLSRYVRGGTVDASQSLQCVVWRGFITDVDSSQFPIPITDNLVTGIRSAYGSLIESRSASKSLAFQAKPLQTSEFFNRRSQMGGMVVKHLFPYDCGSTHYLPWQVREGDLENIEGVNYLDEDTGKLTYVKIDDKHLIGKTIKTRNVTMCMIPHQNGVCEVCFGQMGHSVYRRTNIGFQSTSFMNEIISQATLKVKHLDGSSIVRPMILSEEERKFFTVNKTGDGYYLNQEWGGQKAYLIVQANELPGFTGLRGTSDIRELSYTRTSMMNVITLQLDTPQRLIRSDVKVGGLRRPASFTHDALEYIRNVGWEVDYEGRYVIDLSGWDASKLLMTVPRRNYNMTDLSKEVASRLEATKTETEMRNSDMTKASFITSLFDLINPNDAGRGSTRLNINLSVLSVIAYGVMVVNADPENMDYSLPKPWTRYGVGVYRLTITRRSLGTTMAFQEQRDVIQDPISFTYTNRIDTPMDVFLAPAEVMQHYANQPELT